MKQRAKELYDWDLDVSFRLHFGTVSNSHNCPINGVTNWGNIDPDKPASYLGWSGQVNGTLNGKVQKKTFGGSIADLIKEKFKVIHTGTGCPGRPNEYRIRISCELFLDDFPKLKEKYEFYQLESIKEATNIKNTCNLNISASSYAQNHDDVVKAQQAINRLAMIRSQKIEQHFNDYLMQHEKKPIPLHEDYPKLKQMFT